MFNVMSCKKKYIHPHSVELHGVTRPRGAIPFRKKHNWSWVLMQLILFSRSITNFFFSISGISTWKCTIIFLDTRNLKLSKIIYFQLKRQRTCPYMFHNLLRILINKMSVPPWWMVMQTYRNNLILIWHQQ